MSSAGLYSADVESVAPSGGLCSRDSRHHRGYRVKVYTPSGLQIGLCGVGEEENKLTFPAHYVVDEKMVDTPLCHWIRSATHDELQVDPVWYRMAPFKPACFIHENGDVVKIGQTMGLRGRTLTALQTVPRDWLQIQETPCTDVEDIGTPPTPSPRFR